jgi:beta-lactam-binding protein with PASTA domain
LRLQLENKFYSPNTPSGQVLAQFPAPGATVRRQWPVRVTESLGTQQVSIPDLTGQGERSVSINLRRLGLELGTVGHIAASGSAGVVVAQTPPPNAQGIDRPRVSVLLSQPKDADADAFVMPSLVGLSVAGAYVRTGAAGLKIVSAEDVTPAAAAPTTPANTAPTAVVAAPAKPAATVALAPGIIAAQSPLAGHRVSRGDQVRLSIMH